MATRDKHQPYLAIAQRALGVAHRLAGEFGEAEKRIEAAIKIFENLEMKWQTGRTIYEMGELAIAKSENEAARDHFVRAQEMFEEMGAGPDFARTAVALDRLA